MGVDSHGSEPVTGDESEAPMTQASLEVKSMLGSSAVESVTSMARLSLPEGVLD